MRACSRSNAAACGCGPRIGHGLRASELEALRWDDIDLRTSKLHVGRAKRGTASVHPLRAKELRALRRLLREMPEGQRATCHFVSERMAPLSVAGASARSTETSARNL